MSPFFSIIIPTLNEELFLPKLLNNLVDQKEKNFEIIVVDGKSSDSTKKIVLEYTRLIPVKFLEADKKNAGHQRNLGAKQAEGKYLIFLDADITVSKTFTKNAKKQIENNKGLIFLPYVLPKEKDIYPDINMIFHFLNSLIDISQNFDKPFSAGGCMIWEKKFFQLVEGFDENIIVAEDHSIIRKAYTWGVKAKIIKSLKILFSSRRMKKEGRLKILYKFVVSHFYLLFNKNINKKMFNYDMGGHLYDKKNEQKKSPFTTKKLIKTTEKFFRTILSEE